MSKKNEEIQVTKIIIKMGEKDAELTIEQARQLKDALVELLGEKEKTVYIPSPYIVERPYPYRYPYWYVTWGTDSATAKDENITSYDMTVTYSLNQ